MKKITLTLMLAFGTFFAGTINAQCVANGTLTATGTPGEFTITDLSTGATQPYSYFETYVNATVGILNVPLQATTTTGTIQYPANGTYSWGISYYDSLNGCFDAYWDSITVTGVTAPPPPPGNCQASFTLQQDSLNQNQYWCWNTSTASSPALGLTYLWDFGDGNTSTQAYPTHTYNGLGTYTLCLTISDSLCTSVTCDTIVITVKASGTTINVLPAGTGLSLEENLTIQSLDVYPNPTDGNFTISIASMNDTELKINLLSITGQNVFSSIRSVNAGSNKIEINQDGLKQGVYILRVNELNTKSVKTIRIIKK